MPSLQITFSAASRRNCFELSDQTAGAVSTHCTAIESRDLEQYPFLINLFASDF
jgi:hypothetical protein